MPQRGSALKKPCRLRLLKVFHRSCRPKRLPFFLFFSFVLSQCEKVPKSILGLRWQKTPSQATALWSGKPLSSRLVGPKGLPSARGCDPPTPPTPSSLCAIIMMWHATPSRRMDCAPHMRHATSHSVRRTFARGLRPWHSALFLLPRNGHHLGRNMRVAVQVPYSCHPHT